MTAFQSLNRLQAALGNTVSPGPPQYGENILPLAPDL